MRFQWPMSLVTPVISLGATVTILTFILSTQAGGYGVSNVFAYHPALMTLAFCGLMPLGLLGYVYDFGNRGNAIYSGRQERRLLHGMFMMLATCCILTAYMVAFVYHQSRGISHLALDQEEKTRPAHVFIGFIALGGTALQAVVGIFKHIKYTRDGDKMAQWHGIIGPFVWVCGLLCIALSAWFEYKEGAGHWSLAQAVIMWVLLLALAGAVFAHLLTGSREHVHSDVSGEGAQGSGKAVRLLIQ
jgi:hypothetical protein